MSAVPAESQIRAWKPALPGVNEVLHAYFRDHTYPLHCHTSWTVLIVDAGEVRYDVDRRTRAADTRRVTILPPHVPHDGSSAHAGRGFSKRVLYIDTETIAESLIGPAVDHSAVNDPQLRQSISELHHSLRRHEDDLEWESRLGLVVERIHRHLTTGRIDQGPKSPAAALALREYLDSHPFTRHSLSSIADTLGWSTTHLIRSFTTAFGLPPHRYLIGRRVDEARRLLLAGEAAKDVAAAVGFHDQAHLTRHFTTYFDITPGRLQRSNTTFKSRVQAGGTSTARPSV